MVRKTDDDVAILVRMSKPTRDRLKALAKKRCRSVQRILIWLVNELIFKDQMEEAKKERGES